MHARAHLADPVADVDAHVAVALKAPPCVSNVNKHDLAHRDEAVIARVGDAYVWRRRWGASDAGRPVRRDADDVGLGDAQEHGR